MICSVSPVAFFSFCRFAQFVHAHIVILLCQERATIRFLNSTFVSFLVLCHIISHELQRAEPSTTYHANCNHSAIRMSGTCRSWDHGLRNPMVTEMNPVRATLLTSTLILSLSYQCLGIPLRFSKLQLRVRLYRNIWVENDVWWQTDRLAHNTYCYSWLKWFLSYTENMIQYKTKMYFNCRSTTPIYHGITSSAKVSVISNIKLQCRRDNILYFILYVLNKHYIL